VLGAIALEAGGECVTGGTERFLGGLRRVLDGLAVAGKN
jgi:hypothetical protein